MQTHLLTFQRKLRKNMPKPELVIWRHLRRRQLGVKFRRQYVVNNFIIDFYAPMIKLGIEIDGDTHFSIDNKVQQKDLQRDQELEKCGIKILRFFNPDVIYNIEGVLLTIKYEIDSLFINPLLRPPPLRGGG